MKGKKGTQSHDYVLKIFSGLHQGAEVSLPNGQYKLGNSEACDIVLQDQGIAPEHMAITITDDQLLIVAKDGMVVIEGKKLGDREVTLEPLKIVGLGKIFVGVGFNGDNWQPEILPDMDEDLEESADAQTVNRNRMPMTWSQKILVTTLFLPFIVAMLFILNSSHALDTKGSDKVLKLFQLYNLQEPFISVKKNSGLTVVGYAKDPKQRQALINDLKKIDVPILPKIYADSTIVEASTNILGKLDFPIEALYKGQGRFSLHGILKKEWNVQKVAIKLKQDIPGVIEIVDNVWREEDVLDSLKNILAVNGLKDKVVFQSYSDHFLASGELTAEERKQWMKVKNHTYQKYGKYIVLKENISEPKAHAVGPGVIKLPIKGVHIGELSYITLNDGKKYFEGGSLKSGYIIKSITPKQIVVSIQGKIYLCKL